MTYKVSCALQSLRKQWALDQRELGSLLGEMSFREVSNLELGISQPNVFTLFALELVFGIHPKDIFVELFDKVEEDVARALVSMQRTMEDDESPGAGRKRDLISEALTRVVVPTNRPLYDA